MSDAFLNLLRSLTTTQPSNCSLSKVGSYIIILTLFFFGTMMLLIGIVGEYLGRIFNERKNRPLYYVDEYKGEKEQNL